MRLGPNDKAVPFSAETAQGDTVSLADFAGKPLLLMFFRYASCPMCNLRLHQFAQIFPNLHDRGLEAVAFFHSSAASIRSHAGARRYPLHLAADPRFKVYRAYGVETSWPRFLLSMALPSFYADWMRAMRHGFWGGTAWQLAKMPADFLIGPQGTIVRARYGRTIGDHLPVSTIEEFLQDPDSHISSHS